MNVGVEHVQLDFVKEIAKNITALQVKSNIFSFALKCGQIYIIDLDTPEKVCNFQVPLVDGGVNSEKVLSIWMSDGGGQLFLKTNFAKYYLLNIKAVIDGINKPNKALIALQKLSKRNSDIRTVFWCTNNHLLCGSQKGSMYSITFDDKITADPQVKTILQLKHAIDGIMYNSNIPGIIVASRSKILYWKIHSIGDDELANTLKNDPTEHEQFDTYKGESKNKFISKGTRFAWITNTGIVYGDMSLSQNVLGDAKVLLTMELPHPNYHIRDIILTDYHIIILKGPVIIMVNQLNNKVVFEESIWANDNEKMLGLAVDTSQNSPTYWCFSSENVYEIIIKNESQSIWRLLLDQEKYDEVLGLSDLTIWEKDYVYYKKGERSLKDGELLKASECFGNTTTNTIGSNALLFMNEDLDNKSFEALHIYLLLKLEHLSDENKIQILLVSSWIVWNFMNRLNDIDERINSERDVESMKHMAKVRTDIGNEFKNFLKKYIEILDKATIFQILSRQNRRSFLLYFANLKQDYPYVLSYWIEQENWYESLRVLRNIKDPSIVYKYASTLLINSPENTIIAWENIANLNPVKLIPAILTYFTNYQNGFHSKKNSLETKNYALEYLKWCIEKSETQDAIIYNTTLYMMLAIDINHLKGEDKDRYELSTIKFLKMHSGNYDRDFVLRLSLRFKRIRVSIHLFAKAQLYEEAVNLALENGMTEVAISVANSSDLSSEIKMKKKLWKNIARSLLDNRDTTIDIKHTIRSIIIESKNLIEIKDLIPLFDKFTTIANIKDELINSLERHSQAMIGISEDMTTSIKIKKGILCDITKFKERYQILEPGVSCDSCKKPLQNRKFLVFPCNHCFHTDCLIKMILKSDDYLLKSKIESFQKEIIRGKMTSEPDQLERLICTKCCLCSDININSIDRPLLVNEVIAAKWNI